MNCKRVLLTAVILLCVPSVSQAMHPLDVLREKVEPAGIEIGFGMTNIYQANVRGGISTHNHRGRHTGSYDLELMADLRKLVGLRTGSIFVHLEGGWPDTEGTDGLSVGSAFGVNADAGGNDNIVVKQLFYEGPIFHESLSLMIGKIDFTGIFDRNAYADDETSQFLNAAFVDNPTIPFPAYSLGVVLNWDLTDSWYIIGGIADAQADGRETGFRTAFHKEDYFFYALETGLTPEFNSANGALPGAYRIGLWNDPQRKANTDRADAGKSYHDDVGVYFSADQMLIKEITDPEDGQGLAAFFRYGHASSKKNDITNFWSVGFQYQGLLDGRDDDVLGGGYAQGFFADTAAATYPEDNEGIVEAYYNAQVTPWLNISPNLQYVINPGGSNSASDAVVLGLRMQWIF